MSEGKSVARQYLDTNTHKPDRDFTY